MADTKKIVFVQPVPKALNQYSRIGAGSTGWVYKLPGGIAIKYALEGQMSNFIAENEAYDTFERHDAPATIMQSFLRLPGLNFMPVVSCCLYDRINRVAVVAQRGPDGHPNAETAVFKRPPDALLEQWALEIANAIAWIEGLGLVHGDLRPANMLLDGADHVKLVDFDHIAAIGSPHRGQGGPPWARQHDHFPGSTCDLDCGGFYGRHGATTEQFAYGSVLHNMVTGGELYDEIDHLEADVLLRDMVLPPMGDGPLERLAVRCWAGAFAELAELAAEVAAALPGAVAVAAAAGTKFDDEFMESGRARCRALLEGDLADIVPHVEAKAEAESAT